MTFREDDQQAGTSAADPLSQSSAPEASAAEPRLLTRPDRQPAAPRPRVHRQTAPEKDLRTWSKRLRPATQRKATKTPAPRKIKQRRWPNIAAAIAIFLLLAAFITLLLLRHATSQALPAVDGSLSVPGLHAPVTVSRDAQGVPVFAAQNLPDLLFAQGYITAGDRLWQMDALRRHAAGELADILGSSLVEHDRRQRYLQLRATADRAVTALPPDQLAQLEAYAAGVNAWISTHSGSLPLEFRLLAYTPAPWTPRDSLLVSLAMWQDLSTEFPRKLDREAFSRHLPAQLLSDLYPVGSWRDVPPSAQGRDVTAPHYVEQIPLDPSQSHAAPPPAPAAGPTPKTLLALTHALVNPCNDCRAGSNNWAVTGAHTQSGAPMLSNDMHLNLSIPDLWYEASLHTPLNGQAGSAERLDVIGFTLPGVPFVIVGRNDHVAWGVTNLGADVQDLRVEHLRGSGDSTEFQQTDGNWAPVTHHHETIHVRGGLPVTLDVLTTKHPVPASDNTAAGTMETPILTPLYPGEQRSLSLAWTVYSPGAVSSPFLGADAATDGASLVAALAHFGGPTLNLIWADTAGHIGYHAIGLIPVRGPNVQRPRPELDQAPPTGSTPLPEDGAGDANLPEGAQLDDVPLFTSGPHLVLSAYVPARRHAPVRTSPVRHPAKVARASRTARQTRTARAPRPRRARSQRPQRAQLLQRTQPKAAVAAVTPAASEEFQAPAPTTNYLIGSSIAPGTVDALDNDQAWTAFIPYDALPAVTDPHGGFLATANSRVTPDDYPYALTNDWADPFRTERIVHLLSGSRNLTAQDMLRFDTDVHSEVDLALAQRVAYAIDHADDLGSNAARLHTVANLLRDWDGNMRADSPTAAIVSAIRTTLWPALLLPQIAKHDGISLAKTAPIAELYTWGERTSALELILQHEPARWLPPGARNWNSFLAATTLQALKDAHAPSNLNHWSYGALHTVEIAHPIFGAHPFLARLLGIRATTGRRPAPGDGTTIDQIGTHFGPSERFIADLSSPEAALGNITTGQSANPHSPWYLDQFPTWLAGQSYNLPGTRTAPTHTLTLHP